MKYEIVELEEKVVKGIRIKTTNQEGKSMKDIGMTWQKLFDNRGIAIGILPTEKQINYSDDNWKDNLSKEEKKFNCLN